MHGVDGVALDSVSRPNTVALREPDRRRGAARRRIL